MTEVTPCSPYLMAHTSYHRDGAPWIPWIDALDFHLQHGIVISTPECFLMARRVMAAWSDYEQLTLRAVLPEDGEPDGWHVWSAAGDLDELIHLARKFPAQMITFQRRNERLHRITLEALIRIRAHQR